MKQKILFWVCNFPNSMGEATNAFLFSKKVNLDKYSIFFYAENKSSLYLKSLSCNLLSKEDVFENNFDLIIFSEYYRFIRLLKLAEFDNRFIKFIKKTNKIASFDTLSLGNTKESINTRLEEIPHLKTIYSNELIDNLNFFCIRPCPINNPLENNENSFNWSLPTLERNQVQINGIKKVMGCSAQAKILFFSLSIWQYYNVDEQSKQFFITLLKSIEEILKKLESEIYFIIVSPTELIKTKTSDNLNTIVFNIGQTNFLQANFYEQLILSSDLVLTTNFIQHSFVRAINSGVSAINLRTDDINNIYLKTNKMFQNSIYTKLFENIEFTKENDLLSIFQKVLYNQNYMMEKQNNYNIFREQLKTLPSENEIIEKILSK